MASVTLSPGTMADDATVGTVAWTNPDNAKVSDDVYSVADSAATQTITDFAVKIVKADGTLGTTNKSAGATWSGTESYVSFGSSSDTWGETLVYSDINDIDFGVVFEVRYDNGDGGYRYSHYLKATNFGFTIPAGATINGILSEIERKGVSGTATASVDHIRITVTYTEVPSIVGPFPTFFQI